MGTAVPLSGATSETVGAVVSSSGDDGTSAVVGLVDGSSDGLSEKLGISEGSFEGIKLLEGSLDGEPVGLTPSPFCRIPSEDVGEAEEMVGEPGAQ